jgi:hypothetical protein
LRFWRDERIEMPSSLPVLTAVEQLADGVTSSRGLIVHGTEMGWGSYIVVGEVSQRQLRLTAWRLGVRNQFRQVLRGELTSASDGCVLIGTIGWHPAVRLLIKVTVSVWAVFFLTGVVGSLGVAALGEGASTRGMLALAGATVGLAAFFVGLLAFGGWLGRKDENFLRDWLSVRWQPRP